MSVDAAELLAFVDRGACRGEDQNLFYPQLGESAAPAKALCSECPVKAECLAWALAHEKQGIWGGTSERERRRLRRIAGITVETPAGALDDDVPVDDNDFEEASGW